eukprot:14774893-Ditylum_brightwellii.AAC.2
MQHAYQSSCKYILPKGKTQDRRKNLKSNPTPQRQCPFKPSHPFNRHQQNKRNGVNKIDNANDNKDKESNTEQEQYNGENKTEDLSHINATEYEKDSDSKEYGYSTNNINVNLQQTSGIGIDIEQHYPTSNVCHITQH